MSQPSQPNPAEIFAALSGPPVWYPQQLNLIQDSVLFVETARADYERASFLDDRMLSAQMRGGWMPFAEIAKRISPAQAPPRGFIFHIGHCGSTLLSRLLDLAPGGFSLREPLPLRTLAEEHLALGQPGAFFDAQGFDFSLRVFLALWGRKFEASDAPIVKATSGTNDLARPILHSAPAAKAVMMHLRLEPFLATLLAGPNSHLDLRGHAKARLTRLARDWEMTPAAVSKLSRGALAGYSWLTEMTAHALAAEEAGPRALRLDFEDLLADRATAIASVLEHFGLSSEQATVDALAQADIWRRYSKAPEHDYSPELRAQVLAEARQAHAADIAEGLAAVEQACMADPAKAALVEAFL